MPPGLPASGRSPRKYTYVFRLPVFLSLIGASQLRRTSPGFFVSARRRMTAWAASGFQSVRGEPYGSAQSRAYRAGMALAAYDELVSTFGAEASVRTVLQSAVAAE